MRSIITFIQLGQVRAASEGRDYVLPEDVQAIAYEVLRHRIIRTDDAVIDEVPVDSLISAVLACAPIVDDVRQYQRR